MYVNCDDKIKKVVLKKTVLATEKELVQHFQELCQSAISNPWRGVEFAKAQDLLVELTKTISYPELVEQLNKVKIYRELYVAQPTNKRQPTNWVEAIALKNK